MVEPVISKNFIVGYSDDFRYIITHIQIAGFALAFSCIGFGMRSSAGMVRLRTWSKAGSLA
jgi:hypothetical protein